MEPELGNTIFVAARLRRPLGTFSPDLRMACPIQPQPAFVLAHGLPGLKDSRVKRNQRVDPDGHASPLLSVRPVVLLAGRLRSAGYAVGNGGAKCKGPHGRAVESAPARGTATAGLRSGRLLRQGCNTGRDI